MPWINASSAHLLLKCPARWFAGATWYPTSQPGFLNGPVVFEGAATLGTLVHRAVEQWIHSGKWGDQRADHSAAQVFNDSALSVGAPIGMTRMHASALEVQLGTLRALLTGSVTDATAEVERENDAYRIRGRIDVLGFGADRRVVIDVKSGHTRDRNGGVFGSIRTQMAVYGWLLVANGEPMPQLVVLSLKDGALTLDLDASFVEQHVCQLIEARDVALKFPTATPNPDTCQDCPVRRDCAPHWAAVSAGEITDAVEGRVTRVEESETGRRALIINVHGEESLVTGTERATTLGVPRAGDLMKAVRVRNKSYGRWAAGIYSQIWHMSDAG
ncbi:PD-(D/E)XK nuclease family protein [Rhodococcus opacus]|nr:PD-(D/E)XK nuclease family protein [Rhodococcus opacus]MDJ0412831.1 PD-(D/E)XK nuclease family protein [Rhodococcus opacus]